MLEELVSFCCDLEKLSLAGLQSTKPYFQESILLSSKTMKVLDLNGCKGLNQGLFNQCYVMVHNRVTR